MNTQDRPFPPVVDRSQFHMREDGWEFLCAIMGPEQWDSVNQEFPDGAELVASEAFGQEGVNIWYRVPAEATA